MVSELTSNTEQMVVWFLPSTGTGESMVDRSSHAMKAATAGYWLLFGFL